MNEVIKMKIKERYGRIALTGNSDCCCMPGECNSGDSLIDATEIIGYDSEEMKSIPKAAILGVGCGAPIKFAALKKGETVLDLGSGAGIDAFLAANQVSKSGKIIGIDITDEMLKKARKNASEGNYNNVEFRKGDIEKNIPVNDNTVDVVVSNCVINLTTDKINVFREVYRILKKGGRIVISDLVTDRELEQDQVNPERWCSCIDGALTQEHYIDSIKKAGFQDINILDQRAYMEGEKVDRRKITSIIVRATK